jgi:ribosomal protein L29
MLQSMIDIIDNVISKASAICELAQLMHDNDLLEKVTNLQIELTNLRLKLINTQYENIKLREQVENLEAVIAKELVFKVSAYYRKNSNEAFCPKCVDIEHKLSRLIPTAGNILATTHKCPTCGNRYKLH